MYAILRIVQTRIKSERTMYILTGVTFIELFQFNNIIINDTHYRQV